MHFGSLSGGFRRVVVLLLLAWAVSAAAAPGGKLFHSADVTGTYWGKQLNVADHDGSLRRLEDFRGRVVVLAFGYLQCPNFCPTTLAKLAEVRRLLGTDGERVQVLFVTLDPERDSATMLKAYVTAFDPGFLGLRPEGPALTAVAREFRVFYEKVPGGQADSYSIDHSTSLRVVDAAGRIRLRMPDQLTPPQMADDLRRLLAAE